MAQSPRATKRALASLTLGAVAVTSLAVVSTSTASAVESNDSTVFVNELHYDNDGTDSNELVEVGIGTDIELPELVEELRQVLHHGVAEDLALARLTAAQPLAQVLD